MLFNSHVFIFAFLPIVLIGYFLLNHARLILAGKVWLVCASLFFYSWWNIVYLPILVSSILFNYIIANKILEYDKQHKNIIAKKLIFIVGIVFNIGLLAYFKYMDFFIDNVNFVFGTKFDLLNLALPLAISFFTLQQIAFLVDVYEGLIKERRFIDYALFVSFFPKLIAGPIVYHKEMMPQFKSLHNKLFNPKNFSIGLFVFSIGLFKKVVIADSFAVWASRGFDIAQTLNFLAAWATSLSYTFQLYFDFSGYTDMAIGIALMFNIKIPINFNSPYKATNIINFWQRWHITLSRFITSYIYTPIIKSMPRITFTNSMIATFLAMFIAGLWHGAAWTFVLFGAMHGIALIINHYWRRLKFKMSKFLAWFVTFNFVNISFVVFRATEWEDVIKVLKGMFGFSGIEFEQPFFAIIEFPRESLDIVVMILCCGAIAFIAKNTIELMQAFKPNLLYLVAQPVLLVISVLYLSTFSEFLYFNF
ncbi:MAG: MBOAT family O-acyltransferase [Pseudomonadota bacterium]